MIRILKLRTWNTGIFLILIKISNLKNMDLNGDTDGKSYTVDAPAWVAEESQFAVDDITGHDEK